ncbi:hypothetical protein JW823_02185 [bacterium]|nr:hypothetical protein [candidate division CSSED10-310 bacterium]
MRDPSDKLKSVVVYLEFDQRLQSLTGVSRTSIEVTEGTPFIMLLQAVLESYPDIIHQYAFSSIGFEVNGKTPNPYFLLSAHDVVTLGIQSEDERMEGMNGIYYQ